jgi:hypothetical protein
VPGRYQFSLPERPSRDGWFRLGSIDVTTSALLVGLGVISMFVYAIDKTILEKLAFSGEKVRSGEVWRVVSWPLVNPPTEIWVVLTLAFFWFVGHRIEDTIGRKRFTILITTMTVLPALIVSLISFDLRIYAYGLGILGIALLVVFALDNPGAMFFFGIPAWVIAGVYVGIDVLRYLGDRMYEALVLELMAIAIGLIGARQCGMVSNLTFIPQLGGGRHKGAPKPAKRRGATGGSTVVAGPWGAAEPAHTAIDQMELDLLLDKISANGMDSLSRSEKTRLNELSKKLRGR